MWRTASCEKTPMLGKSEGGRRGGRDGWMASLTRWTWVLVNSRNGWWTGRPGVLQCLGLQRVGRDGATELKLTVWHWIVYLCSEVCKSSGIIVTLLKCAYPLPVETLNVSAHLSVLYTISTPCVWGGSSTVTIWLHFTCLPNVIYKTGLMEAISCGREDKKLY